MLGWRSAAGWATATPRVADEERTNDKGSMDDGTIDRDM